MTFQLDVIKLSWSKSIFDAFTRLIKGVAGSGVGSGRRDLGLTINEMPFYGLYRLTTFQIDSNKAHGVKIDFKHFYLYKKGRGRKSSWMWS